MKKCKFNEEIYLYCNDELESNKVEKLLEHLKSCKECKEEFEAISSMEKELNKIEDVELPEGYKNRLHEKLKNIENKNKIFSFDNYAKAFNRIIPVAAAVVLFVVAAKGYHYLSPMFNQGGTLSQSSNTALDNLTSSVGSYNNYRAEDAKGEPLASEGNINGEESINSSVLNKNTVAEKTELAMQKASERNFKNDSLPNNEVHTLDTTADRTSTDSPDNMELAMQKSDEKNFKNDSSPNNKVQASEDTVAKAVNRDNNFEKSRMDSIKGKELTFETVFKSSFSKQSDRQNYVVKDIDQWKKLWSDAVSGETAVPEIDFNKYMIIAVFQGTKNTGGYGIKITEIIEAENALEVYFNETVPAADSIVTQVMTSPCHIVKVEKTDKEVLFKKVQ